MVRKETFRGKTEEQMKDVGIEDFLPMLTSRERRTVLRMKQNPTFKKLVDKVRRMKEAGSSKTIRTHAREAVILPEWLGMKFAVYNGKQFKEIEITVRMLGRRLGDFAHSTGRVLHSGPGVGATRGSKFVPLK